MEKSRQELQREIDMLRQEIKVAREAAEITADFVVKQFEQTEQMLHRFQSADAERQAVLDAATQLSIIATYLDGTIQLFSTGASTLLGYKPAEMINKQNILSLHLPEELDHYGRQVSPIVGTSLHGMEVFDQFVKQKHSRAREWKYVCRDGSHLPVSLSVTSLYNPVGRVVGYLFAAMDMTRHKQMERELIQARDQAESANASRGDFLARMSHEIRTPMNGIVGMASLLQKTALDPKQHNYVEKLLGSANTLLRLIYDILDFSKIDAGKLELEEVAFNLEDILGNIANVIGMQAEKKGLEFLFRISPEVPYNLIGDPLRLGQVLMNLAGNAVKFTERGEIVISVSLEERKPLFNNKGNTSSDGSGIRGRNEMEDCCSYFVTAPKESEVFLRFSVRDSGIGLRPEQIKLLFSAFSQADDSITRKYGGTGLGLAICKQLSELMGGRIWIESVPGRGSEFIFTARMRLSSTVRGRRELSPEHLQGLRALVVDDNEAAREVLSSMLSSLNIKVDTAGDGLSALESLEVATRQGHPYDVVLLDWIMPGIDGIETARRIKANESYAKLPAMLMVTANGREEAIVEAGRVGLNGFLLKPVYASVMYNTLLEILGIESVAGPVTTKEKTSSADLTVLGGARILLVDDNTINQEVAMEFLRDAGMMVDIATNGRECLNALHCSPYDLVLMDIQMPVMDGLEATRRIRQSGRFKDLPVIAMTAHAMTGDREKSLAAGMNDHITKPIDPEALYQALKKWIVRPPSIGTGRELAPEPGGFAAGKLPLPPLPGIDQAEAMKILNNKAGLFIKMLYDFRKNYSSLPAVLRELAAAGDWAEIRKKAHTVKGVAGYIGSVPLQQAAAILEEALRSDLREKAVQRLAAFIDALDAILSSLATLPANGIDAAARPLPDLTVEQPGIQQAEEPLRLLIGQLTRGEVAAEDRAGEVAEILAGSGFAGRMQEIVSLIEDIEYESAAKKAQGLLAQLREKRVS